MTEWRRHRRIKVSCPVLWSYGFLGRRGQAVIRNISMSGIMLEVDESFEPVEDGQYSLQVLDPASEGIVPRDVKLLWCARVKTGTMRRFCGMKFIHSEGPVFVRLQEHVQSMHSGFSEATDAKIIEHYLSQSN